MPTIERLRTSDRPIAFAHYSVPNDVSGVTTWLQGLLLRLHADGVPLVVLLHHLGRDPEKSSLAATLREKGIPVEVQMRSATMAEDLSQTIDFLERHRPIVFLPQCLNVFYYAAATAGDQGLPWCMTLHSDDPDYWAIAEAIPAEQHGGATVCVSKHLVEVVMQKGLAKVPVMIAYGTRIPEEQARFSATPFTVVYSGRMLEEQKRISLILATLESACTLDPRIQAVLIGDGQGAVAAKARVAEAGLAERIRFTGRLAPEKVADQLIQCQASLLMSDFEGLPLTLLETMALGVVPVVRSIESGIPELVQHNSTGVLVNEDPNQASAALIALANDPERWARCSAGARALIATNYAAEHNYTNWVDQMAAMMESPQPAYPLRVGEIQLPAEGSLLGKGYKRKYIPPSLFRRVVNKVKHLLSITR